METARMLFEVCWGLIPGKPDGSQKFGITSGEWESPDRDAIYNRVFGEAVMLMLQKTNPQQTNWVRLDWIWL